MKNQRSVVMLRLFISGRCATTDHPTTVRVYYPSRPKYAQLHQSVPNRMEVRKVVRVRSG
jgi:hypothetical protein